MPLTPSLEIMLTLFLVTAVISDLGDHRIPNLLTLLAAATGVASHLYLGGLQGVGFALGGLALGMFCLLPFYALGGMGAGDVKMMGAIGAFVGPQATLLAVGVALVCGALGALVLLLCSALVGERARVGGGSDQQQDGSVTAVNGVFHTVAVRKTLKSRFPYALAVAAGGVASMVYLRF